MTTSRAGPAEMMEELHRIKVRTRGDRRATSTPLIIFGVLTLGYAGIGADGTMAHDLYWVLAAPGGFALVAWYYRRHEIGTGVGARSAQYRTGAIVLAILAVLVTPVLLIVGGPFVLVGLALGVIALRQGNLFLALSAIAYGVLGALVAIDFIPNRLYDLANALGFYRGTDGYFSWAPALAAGILGLLMTAVGLWSRRREGRAAALLPT